VPGHRHRTPARRARGVVAPIARGQCTGQTTTAVGCRITASRSAVTGDAVSGSALDRAEDRASRTDALGKCMRIDRITARNFKNLADLDLALEHGTVIVGENRAGTGGSFTLLLAFRRQRSTEIIAAETRKTQERVGAADRAADASERDAEQRRITELYTKAADQLGSEKAPVRLAGLHARWTPGGKVKVLTTRMRRVIDVDQIERYLTSTKAELDRNEFKRVCVWSADNNDATHTEVDEYEAIVDEARTERPIQRHLESHPSLVIGERGFQWAVSSGGRDTRLDLGPSRGLTSS
jgi:hypothetical protein